MLRIALLLLFSFAGLAADVWRVSIDGPVTAVTADYIGDAIKRAEIEKPEALLIEIDTPGGLMDATRQIVSRIAQASVPVIAYVTPSGGRAGSAGVFLMLAADVAAMAPQTNMGAAHPVSIFGSDIEGEMAKKVENDAAAWARSLAQEHGRNVQFAEAAVRESKAISASEALKMGVIDLVAKDTQQLLQKIDGRRVKAGAAERVLATKEAKIVDVKITGARALVQFFSDPNVLYILMLLGMLLIFIEFQTPGLTLPGLVGGLCLALVFGVQLLPINWFGALMIFGAVGLLVAEVYITSFGLLTLAALTLLVLGSYILFDAGGSGLMVRPTLIWSLAISFAAMMVGFGYFILRAKRQGATSNIDALVGREVVVVEAVAPHMPGRVRLNGVTWVAIANEELPVGAHATVVGVDSAKLVVRKI